MSGSSSATSTIGVSAVALTPVGYRRCAEATEPRPPGSRRGAAAGTSCRCRCPRRARGPPPCASAIRRETTRPRPVPGMERATASRAPEEALEHTAALVLRDTGARVLHLDRAHAVRALEPHRDRAVVRGELDRVREKVVEDLAEAHRVSRDDVRTSGLQPDRDRLARRRGLDALDAVPHDLVQLDRGPARARRPRSRSAGGAGGRRRAASAARRSAARPTGTARSPRRATRRRPRAALRTP